MKPVPNLMMIIVAALLAPVAMAGVTVDFDKTLDFTRFKTYMWIEGTPAQNDFAEKRIREAVDEQLQANGLRRVEDSPDILVATHAKMRVQEHIDSTSVGYGGRGPHDHRYSAGVGATNVTVFEIPVGTLTVDLLNGSKEIIWRSTGEEILSNKQEKNEKKIDKLTKKMFKDYPPEKK